MNLIINLTNDETEILPSDPNGPSLDSYGIGLCLRLAAGCLLSLD
jgi:hypothetical protein